MSVEDAELGGSQIGHHVKTVSLTPITGTRTDECGTHSIPPSALPPFHLFWPKGTLTDRHHLGEGEGKAPLGAAR